VARGLSLAVVEDHDDLRESVVEFLNARGHAAIGFPDAESFDEREGLLPLEVLVVDLNLPGEDGLSLARRVRLSHPQIGIVMMTARREVADRVAGYRCGADVYLPKPVDPDELGAALEAIARRIGFASPPVVLDQARLVLTGPSAEVAVGDSERAVLCALAAAPSGTLDSWQLKEILGGDPESFARARLEMRMSRLRHKLALVGCGKDAVKSIRGVGYRLAVPLQIV
jgi:DNA-binding response OmpR family regulator